MKNLHFIGFLLLGLAFLLYYISPQFSWVKLVEPISLMGILAGIGIGLIIGGIVGYVSKGTALKEEQKRKELKQLRKDKEELEKQTAKLTQEKQLQESESLKNENPQSFY
ncbi:MAG: hypothetical protein BGO40_04150 [Chryseobacterium sp. 39-10]|nr:hypothetical protein [Chryseobacterium sp.]OJV48908.1 MAG: hypothetical protein BGO40_04150 [Chryseobacterium sp. 39-10]